MKTKLGLTASALILVHKVKHFVNTLNAFDPMQMVIGQDLGEKIGDVVSAQNSISPKMVQSQLNALPEAIKLNGNAQPKNCTKS